MEAGHAQDWYWRIGDAAAQPRAASAVGPGASLAVGFLWYNSCGHWVAFPFT